MRTETLVESQDTVLALEPGEAEALRSLGLRLASKKAWWGDDGDGIDKATSVIRVRPVGDGHWSVRVSDAVGLVSIGSLQLLVGPKIPTPHMLYLFARSGAFPRLDEQAGEVSAADSLWELVATWFVRAFERLLRRDLVRDYEEMTDDLRAARGRIEPGPTTTLFYGGRPELACRFDEFGYDTPLNRVLRAATRIVVASPLLRPEFRRAARRLEDHLADVGELRPDDLLATTDRRTGHYADAVALARSLLRSTGRSLSAGGAAAWTFLIRTPEMVEAGIRAVLAERLGARMVRK
ncbi:MAG: 5-methylcytosine restriction system specificity protein McrC, partial [Candidatus Limnocylindrales bacterium]